MVQTVVVTGGGIARQVDKASCPMLHCAIIAVVIMLGGSSDDKY